MLKGIIFDMDGVLINSEPFHYRVWKESGKRPSKEEAWIWTMRFTRNASVLLRGFCCNSFINITGSPLRIPL